MTATDELRAMLDALGIKHFDYSKSGWSQTQWEAPDGNRHFTYETYNNPAKTAKLIISWFPTPEQAIAATLGAEINGDTSDGYHTFNELYHHRAVLFSVVVASHREIAWKAKKHHDGTMYDGMFIVGIDTPWGQASYHYDLDPYWDMFDCEEREAAPEWDGHTPDDAIERIGKLVTLGTGECELVYGENGHGDDGWWCQSCGGWFAASFRHTKRGNIIEPSYCQQCGKVVKHG